MKKILMASFCAFLSALPACGGGDSNQGRTSDSLQGDAANACEKGFSAGDPQGRECNATHDGQCFENNADACACAACPDDDCLVLESFPTQVRCASPAAPSPNPDEPTSSSPVTSDPATGAPPSGTSPGSPGSVPSSPGLGGVGSGTISNVPVGSGSGTPGNPHCRILESFPVQVVCE